MPKGNPNPSPSTRIGAENGPRPGKKPGQRALEIANAEMATRIRNKLLTELAEKIKTAQGAAAMAEIRGDVLKLLKDSEDRGFGAPKQELDHTSTDGSMTPVNIVLRAAEHDNRND